MFAVRKVTNDLYWVGGNDHRLALFENVLPIPAGVSYNSYLLMDENTVLFDTVDWAVCRETMQNIESVLNGRPLDYMVINHMEPDHCGSIDAVIQRFPDVKLISTEKAYMIMHQFGYHVDDLNMDEVTDGDVRSFGKHEVTFVKAPMVHWPEVMVTFDITNGVLFSADAFGTFIALDGKLFNDEVNFDRDWLDEARRYFTNIVGKYGPFVQLILKKAATLDIKMICPLHGPVWRSDLGYILDKYDKWSKYEPEEKGVLLVYASMYGNTEYAAQALASRLCEKGMTNIHMYDVSSTDVSYLISETFRLSNVVLASVTYNLKIYPPMHNYLEDMKALNLQNRTFSIIENGTWCPTSGELIKEFLENEMKDMTVLDETMSITSAIKDLNEPELDEIADSIIASMK